MNGLCPTPNQDRPDGKIFIPQDALSQAFEEADHSFDSVDKPKHYAVFEDLEAIEIIACTMTEDQFFGYCLGNTLKYRLRAGNKDKLEQDIGKAEKYKALFKQHKHLCKEI